MFYCGKKYKCGFSFMVFTEIVAKFGAKVLPFVELVMLESQQISHKSFLFIFYLRITTATAA
jgi:hypothetical protein